MLNNITCKEGGHVFYDILENGLTRNYTIVSISSLKFSIFRVTF